MNVLQRHDADLSRRAFLKVGAAAGGGLMIGWVPQLNAEEAAKKEPLPTSAYVHIDPQGKVRIVCPMAEMGQGVYTALPMIVAEELDIDMSTVSVEHSPPSDKLYGNAFLGGAQTTGNSSSIRGFYEPLRQVGATARAMLIAAAAQKLGVGAETLTTEPGYVIAPGGKRFAYGELADAAAKLPAPANVKLKDPSTFRIIGTAAKRLDVSGKINGAAVFGIDVKVPGMKVATVAASPVFGGTLSSFDDAAALKVPGVIQVAKLDNAVAVIADHYWAARKGLEAGAAQFDDGAHAALATADVVAELAKAAEKEGAVAKNEGDVASSLAKAATRVDAVYEAPFLAHATMEPMNCTAHVTADGCDLWLGTQVPTSAQQAVAKALDLKPEQVRLHNHLLGGGFGRRLEFDYVVQAALVAKQAKVPIKLVWSREEDIQHDMYRPYYYDRISAGLDEQGKPVAWSHRIVGSSVIARFFPPLFKDGIDPDAVDGAIDMPYAIPNKRVEYVRQEPPGIPTAFWRGVGPTHNVYVIESFVDELAAIAKKDPVDYRRTMLGENPRALHVLNRAAEIADWGKPLGERRGRGACVHNTFGSFMSQIAEVTVADTGEVRVDRVVCVVDTGVAVNPDTIVAQMESGIIFGITAVLWGEITLKNGRVQQSNFDDYRMLRINEAPIIEVEVVKSSEKPGGIGEPATSALMPAVLNAVYDATGVRLRKLPIKPDLLKSASSTPRG